VNHSVCLDYASWFPDQCSGGSGNTPATGASIPGDGTFLAGTDITPGTYKSAPSRDLPRQWWTQSELGNDSSQTGFDGSDGHAYTTIRRSDAAFHTQFCQTWTKVR